MIHRFNRTKIITTIGPATEEKHMLEQIIRAGADVCRINSSHGDHAMMKKIIDNVRELNKELKCNVAVLFDLQGPKLRIGDIENGELILKEGELIKLTSRECLGTTKKLYIKYPLFHHDVEPGEKVLIDDGKLELEITDIKGEEVMARITHGGILTSRKGVNLPNTNITLPSLTEKDKIDLAFALENNVEWIGLSFVRKAQDVLDLKNIIKQRNSHALVIAKIEKPEAVINIDRIIYSCDGIMVARGDLGVEMPMEKVPVIQKTIVKKCNAASKPVIIATQMLESMITSFRPTRAEANDVGNAVFDGADALMLSAETSVGRFPVQTVEAMQKIISEVELLNEIYFREKPPLKESLNVISDSICYTACTMARQTDAAAIIAMTHSGGTAFKISAHRPNANIFIFTDNKSLLNILSLLWGVRVFYYDKYESTDTTISDIRKFLTDNHLVEQGEMVIHVASTPLHERTTANTVKLSRID
jgi:pyruvate kinase